MEPSFPFNSWAQDLSTVPDLVTENCTFHYSDWSLLMRNVIFDCTNQAEPWFSVSNFSGTFGESTVF